MGTRSRRSSGGSSVAPRSIRCWSRAARTPPARSRSAATSVVAHGDRAAVVDFDDAALGDPYADLGSMLASLPVDARALPCGTGAAETAYLDGYREATGRRLDERRLRAHVLRAGLALLANRLRKGRLTAAEAADAVARLRAAAGES